MRAFSRGKGFSFELDREEDEMEREKHKSGKKNYPMTKGHPGKKKGKRT